MKKLFLGLTFLLTFSLVYAQPFSREFNQFHREDSITFPAKGQILFIGSSSFTIWQDVSDYFPGYHILNRGFGGSTLTDVIDRADQVIFKYAPRQVVIYCGENDLAVEGGEKSKVVVQRFKKLFCMIRDHYPGIPVTYISIKPSPARANLMPQMVEVNAKIKSWLSKKKHTSYVNVYDAMLDENGKPMEHIFQKDKLHMLPAGYKIWQKLIAPVLTPDANK